MMRTCASTWAARGAPRSVEEGAASVLFGVTATETVGVFRDGRRIAP
jgi:hypothetical protein